MQHRFSRFAATILLLCTLLASCTAPAPGSTVEETSPAPVSTPEKDEVSTGESPTPFTAQPDPMDTLDYGAAEEFSFPNPFDEGFRVKKDGTICFCIRPFEMLRDYWAGSPDYALYAMFTYASEGDKEFTFPSVFGDALFDAMSYCVDLPICQTGKEPDFCPEAGSAYRALVAVVDKANPKNVLYYGTFEVTAPQSLAKAKLYAPTDRLGESLLRFYSLRFKAGENGTVTGDAEEFLPEGMRSRGTVSALPAQGYEFITWSDGCTEKTRTGVEVHHNTVLTAIFGKIQNDGVPSIYLFTENGDLVRDKNAVPGSMVVAGAKKSSQNGSFSLEIKGRGNSSFETHTGDDDYKSKNSYSIKLDEKAQLLGIGSGKSKKWALNSCKFDASELRNFIAWDLANRMGTFSFVPDCAWVRLYFNGAYRGLYMLTERVNIEKGRIDIEDEKTGSTDREYLIEADFRGNTDLTTQWFRIDGYGPRQAYDAIEFVVKNESADKKDLSFLKNYLQKCHDAIVSGNREEIEKNVDLPSLIDMYILEEFGKDCDAGRASFFMVKQAGGKLAFTAPWDFDFCFGTYGPAEEIEGFASINGDCCPWFETLRQFDWFVNAVHERMRELSPALDSTIAAMRKQGEKIRAAADENAAFWDLYGNDYHEYVADQVSGQLQNYDEHLDFLESWMRSRWQWMLEN